MSCFDKKKKSHSNPEKQRQTTQLWPVDVGYVSVSVFLTTRQRWGKGRWWGWPRRTKPAESPNPNYLHPQDVLHLNGERRRRRKQQGRSTKRAGWERRADSRMKAWRGKQKHNRRDRCKSVETNIVTEDGEEDKDKWDGSHIAPLFSCLELSKKTKL